MRLRGELYRDYSAYGLRVNWEIWKHGFGDDGDVIAEGSASSWETAAKQLGEAMKKHSSRKAA